MSFTIIEDLQNQWSGYSVNGNGTRTLVCHAGIVSNYKDYLPITLSEFTRSNVKLGSNSSGLSITSQSGWSVVGSSKIDGVSINYKNTITIKNSSSSSKGILLNCTGTMTFADYTYKPTLTAEFINLLCRLWPQMGDYSHGHCDWSYVAVNAGDVISRSTLVSKFQGVGWVPSIDSTKPLESNANAWYNQIIGGTHAYFGDGGHSPLHLFTFSVSTS